ncbi:ribonuclease J [Agaribacter flavus]|uniref:Ribonuclease J n=1 Tax=Agaribacter flavus TaxID=1902781 RepID=A0ABV7FP54_9ALTE
MNLNLYGHSGRWLMVDCGITFNVPLDPQNDQRYDVKREDCVIPDASFIYQQADKLAGIVITHGHEDHIGALINIWPKLQCPIYTTAFTAEIIRRKFYANEQYVDLPLVEVATGAELDIGPYTVRWLSITHSIPETQALLISTQVGNVFHTADWKIDASPVVGLKFKPSRFKSLATKNVLAMVCDSTNALQAGYSISERACEKGLGELISKAKGRVVVSCFASNLARVLTLAKIAKASGRYLALAGRSLENMVSIARLTGYWPEELHFTPLRHIGYLPPHEILLIATGSQGEPKSALHKMAMDSFRHCSLEKNDTVIFSSIVIPGNEPYVSKVCQQLKDKGVRVIQSNDTDAPIHASGHPNEEDLKDMYAWVKPQIAVPTHGEQKHMLANAELAKAVGVKQQLVGMNGDLFSLAPRIALIRSKVKVGRVALK